MVMELRYRERYVQVLNKFACGMPNGRDNLDLVMTRPRSDHTALDTEFVS